jgi:ketosteroid isomerase-like protein
MSQENVEIVRAVWKAFERNEFPAHAFADDAVWHTSADLPDRETCVGPMAIGLMLAEGWANVVDPGLKAEEFRDVGGQVLVRWRGWGKGRSSGVPIDWHETHTYVVRDDRITEVREYRTWEQALEAAGLSE